MTTLAVVLAAGAGSRFAGAVHKLDAVLGDGRTVSDHAIDAAIASGIGPVLVVTGSTARNVPEGATAVGNPDWEQGQATSLQAAIAVAHREGADAIVVGLADQPLIEPEAWRQVAASRSPIAVATYPETGDAPRNPVRLDRSVWSLLPTTGDHGARDLIRTRPDLVERVPCRGSAADVDTIEDLARVEDMGPWQNSSSTNSR